MAFDVQHPDVRLSCLLLDKKRERGQAFLTLLNSSFVLLIIFSNIVTHLMELKAEGLSIYFHTIQFPRAKPVFKSATRGIATQPGNY
jgi:hypothetical protein